jgi:hypothetical protein
MWIATFFFGYLDWKYWNGPAHDLAAGRLLIHAFAYMLGGLLFGWFTWNGGTGKDAR